MRRFSALLWLALSIPCACSRNPARVEPIPGTLNLAYLEQPQVGIVHIALEKGFFAAEGLTVKAQPFEFGKPALASVIKGESDLSLSAETPVIFALLEGENLGIAAVIGTWDKNSAVVANRSSGIQIPADLAGKTIGVAKGTSGEYFLESFILARGIDRQSVRIAGMEPAAMAGALMDGSIDAVSLWLPDRLTIAQMLADRSIVFFEDDVYTEHLCVTGKIEYLRNNPAAIRAFMTAIIRAEDFMMSNPDEAIDIIARYSNSDVSRIHSVLETLRVKVSIDQSLVFQLEDETRWALSLPSYAGRTMPDYLDHIYTDALENVAPDRMRLIR